jgi:hypothetical protein
MLAALTDASGGDILAKKEPGRTLLARVALGDV